jgi:hypothetical protein
VDTHSERASENIGQHAVVAAFAHRGSAHDAAKRLRDAGFNKVWIGVTSAYVEGDGRYNTGKIGTNIESDDDSIGAKIGRFFSDEADGSTLTETLLRHGVTEAEARRIDATIEPDNALLTVGSNDHPELIAQIVESCGGGIISGESLTETPIKWTEANPQANAPTLRDEFYITRFEDQ